MERLASLVPPPRANQVHYHGLFAPRSKWRKSVLPKYRKGCSEEWQKRHLHRKLVRADRKAKAESRHLAWSFLLKRVFDVAGRFCPHCGKSMGLRAVVVYTPSTSFGCSPATRKVLKGLRGRGPTGSGMRGTTDCAGGCTLEWGALSRQLLWGELGLIIPIIHLQL